jgi:hypothetical protein
MPSGLARNHRAAGPFEPLNPLAQDNGPTNLGAFLAAQLLHATE